MAVNKLGRYDIIRVLGKGAMGLVYEARDPNLDRRVAIKTIKVENLSEEAALEYEARFRTEARSAARLQHPNIVSVYDSDRHGDIAYLVMEYIQGEDLKHHLDGGRLYSFEQSLGMVGGLLSALDYAHRQNIVHRDVKPANLLIEADGRVKLADFGVARIQDSGEATRTKGSMVGTLKYMSPEQVQGQPIDSRADLFAAGIVLYQLLTGKRPFDGDSEFAIIHQIISQDPAPPSSINALLPGAIDAVLARALAKQRDQRFATAQDFALALQEASGQAADPTIIPPVSLSGGRAGIATGSGLQGSRGGGPTVRPGTLADDTGSTVTQELELVYWKDVKDSGDQQDLEGFLDRFPAGIYADLARRRLKRMAGAAQADGSGTGPGALVITAGPQAQIEPTLLQARAVSAALADAMDSDATRMDNASVFSAKVMPEVPPAADAAQELQPIAAAQQSRRSKTPLLALAGVAVLVAAGLAFKLLPGPDAPANVASAPVASEAPATSPTPPSAAPAATVAEPAAIAPPATVTSATAISVAAVAVPPKPPAKPVVGAVVEKPQGSKQGGMANAGAPEAGTAAALASNPNQGPVKAAAIETNAPATVPAPMLASSPAQACEGRLLLGFQICMNEQCAKPAFSDYPVCVERRAADKARRDSQATGRN